MAPKQLQFILINEKSFAIFSISERTFDREILKVGAEIDLVIICRFSKKILTRFKSAAHLNIRKTILFCGLLRIKSSLYLVIIINRTCDGRSSHP